MLMLLVISSSASALGVVPSSKEIMFEPGAVQAVELMVKNNEHKGFKAAVYVEGELADYIEVEESLIELSASEDSKIITLHIQMPQAFEQQGLIGSRVVIREVAEKGPEGTGVVAQVAVASKLTLRVPYSGKYAEIRLLAPEFVRGAESNFAVEVHNHGDEDIEEAQAYIDIYGPLNNKLFTLAGEKSRVEAKEKSLLIVKWVPQVSNGPYKAVATVMYDGKSAIDELGFQIGEPQIIIDSVSVTDFTLGGIAKFDILVSSNWGVPIEDVYGWVKVSDDKSIYTSYKTASMTIDAYGKQVFQGYWDTEKVVPGPYNLDVLFNYLGKTSQRIYDIVVKQDEIEVPQAGMATTEVEGETKTSIIVLAVVVFLVLIATVVNTIILVRRFRR